MHKKALTILLLILASGAYAQDTVHQMVISGIRRVSGSGAPTDTNRLVYDENGKLLHYYQYQKLLITGEYALRIKAGPGVTPGTIPANAPAYLVKNSPEQLKRVYEMLKPRIVIKSALLREGNKLDLTPFMTEFGKEEFAGKKALVLIFWDSTCLPCLENLAFLDDYFKQIANPNDMMVIAVSRDSQQQISIVTLQKNIARVHFIGGSVGQGIEDYYQLHSYPSYVVADKDLIIRFGITGAASVALPYFKDTINKLLAN